MNQAELFEGQQPPNDVGFYAGVLPTGLVVLPHFLSLSEERSLLAALDSPESAPWLTDLHRRVKHFGFRYNYKARALSQADRVADLPKWARDLGDRLVENGYFEFSPEQVIVNEYLPGQGIAPHIDRDMCFGPAVASVSLGSDIVMDFMSDETRAVGHLLLPRRSALVLLDDARYKWKHSIAARRRDSINGFEFKRDRRVSLTFRTVILEDR